MIYFGVRHETSRCHLAGLISSALIQRRRMGVTLWNQREARPVIRAHTFKKSPSETSSSFKEKDGMANVGFGFWQSWEIINSFIILFWPGKLKAYSKAWHSDTDYQGTVNNGKTCVARNWTIYNWHTWQKAVKHPEGKWHLDMAEHHRNQEHVHQGWSWQVESGLNCLWNKTNAEFLTHTHSVWEIRVKSRE